MFLNEEGGVYPIVVVLIPVLLLFAGLLLDLGMSFYQQTKLTHAVDAAAISSLDAYDREEWEENEKIVIDHMQATQIAKQYLKKNMPDAIMTKIRIEGSHVYLEARAIAQLFFAKLLGKSDIEINASARASLFDDSHTDDS